MLVVVLIQLVLHQAMHLIMVVIFMQMLVLLLVTVDSVLEEYIQQKGVVK